jgi:hypothetical protein
MRLCIFNGFGVRRKSPGAGAGVNRSAGGIGLVVVCVGLGRYFEPRLETGRWFGAKKGAPRRLVVRRTE